MYIYIYVYSYSMNGITSIQFSKTVLSCFLWPTWLHIWETFQYILSFQDLLRCYNKKFAKVAILKDIIVCVSVSIWNFQASCLQAVSSHLVCIGPLTFLKVNWISFAPCRMAKLLPAFCPNLKMYLFRKRFTFPTDFCSFCKKWYLKKPAT